MQTSRFRLTTRDDAEVVVHTHVPDDGRVRGVVNLAHGMADHARRYDHLAAALTAAGIALYAEDHRGHGESVASEDDLGHFADSRGWALVLDDLHRVTLRARADHPDVPVAMIGISAGSYLAQQYLFTFPGEIDAYVLLAASRQQRLLAEAGPFLVRAERARLGPRGRSQLLDRILFGAYNKPFEPARTPFDWLSRDEEQVDLYLADPRCGYVPTTQFYLDLAAGVRVSGQVDRVRAGARPDTPVLVLAGGDDPAAGPPGVAALLDLYESAGLTAVEHRLYPGARHELLFEANRDEVIADLLAWIETQLG